MAAVSVLPSYQQQHKFVGGFPYFSGRRTLRIREKYVVLLVFALFGFVCFGGIFFLPDLRDRVSSDGYAGAAVVPDRFGGMFVPRMNGSSGARNRHGLDEAEDPHRGQDWLKFRQRISMDLPGATGDLRRPNTSSDVEVKPEKDLDSVPKPNLPISAKSNASEVKIDKHPEEDETVTKMRQEKIKEVGTVLPL